MTLTTLHLAIKDKGFTADMDIATAFSFMQLLRPIEPESYNDLISTLGFWVDLKEAVGNWHPGYQSGFELDFEAGVRVIANKFVLGQLQEIEDIEAVMALEYEQEQIDGAGEYN